MFSNRQNTNMSNQVSWQTAFWTLVPIAINSMCQPCGKILGQPSKYGFYLSSSPIICVANASELVFNLIWRSCSTRSVKTAASLTANEVFEDLEDPGRHGELAQLQEMNLVRFLVFALGAMPQVIKLYALSGIPGTKICASLYLGSFVAIEVIMTWLRYYRSSLTLTGHSDHGRRTDLCEYLRTFAFFITINFSSVAFVGTAFKEVARSDLSYAGISFYWAFVGLVGLWSQPYTLFYPPGASSRRSYLAKLQSKFYYLLLVYAIIVGLVCAIPGQCAAIRDFDTPPIDLSQGREKGPWNAILIDVHFLYLCLIVSLFLSTHLLATRRAFRARPKIQHCASIAFMLLHFVAAILLYSFEYDPHGTFKPDWTNNFG